MRVRLFIASRRSDERGGVLVMVALWLPVLILMLTFVVDVGNWFVHKRHLQMQADAAALAAAQAYQLPCSDTAITSRAASYSGGTYNAQIGGTPASRVHMLINSKTFYNQPSPSDDTTASPPCSAGMIDVKMTEGDLPWFFKPVGGLLSGVTPTVRFINAQARVSINQIDSSAGALPVGVPDVNPRSARAYFIHESTGAVIASAPLTRVGTSNGLVVWDNAASPQAVTVSSADTDVGVVIALGGLSNTTCGQPLVQCYDAGAALNASSMPTTGLVHIQGWSAAGSAVQPNAPLLRQATLVPGTCTDPYFNVSATACTIGLVAKVDFGTTDPVNGVGAQLTASVAGKSVGTLTYNATSGLWTSPTTISVSPASGPVNVSLDWAETKGTQGGNACSTQGGNKCKGSFGVVQRAFAGSDTRSGPIQLAQVFENGAQWANALERCSTVQTSCTHQLVVRIGIKGNLANASSTSDPVVALRVVGGSQNQSLDCDPNLSKLKDEIATGCAPRYARNTGATTCPGSASTLWASPQPWTCVAIQTGSATNQVPAGMNTRILGTDQPTSCTAPNHWSQFPNLDPSDPRIIEVLLTPFGSFSGNGSTTVPVSDFATFYVTGWTGQGQGFNNPCQGNGDDPVPNNDAGYIVGHFIKYIQTLNPGGGTTPCDLTAFGACVAVMTR
jgi:Putative Flp pilus-assembly TadE/G-like